MNWLKKPATPKLIKIMLATFGIGAVLMIAFGEYLVGFGFLAIFLGNYLQYRTKK